MRVRTDNFPDDAAYQVSRAVIEEVAPGELEVALGFLEPLIEMAEEGELPIIDPRDPGGGFGASDPLFVTIVPSVVRILQSLYEEDFDVVWSRAAEEIATTAKTIGSRRAQQKIRLIENGIRQAVERAIRL